MKQEVIDARCAAYEAAVLAGGARYGTRGKVGALSAVQMAARRLGLKASAGVIAALRAAGSADIEQASERRAKRKQHALVAQRLRKQVAIAHERNKAGLLRIATRIETEAGLRNAGATRQRQQNVRRARKRHTERALIEDEAQRLAIDAKAMNAKPGRDA